ITVGMTFIATAWAISYVGATPVFVDIDPARRTMCPAKLETAITRRTKAIIPIHLYGMPAEMDAINTIADRHGLPIIEDAAQAHGARYRGTRVGQFGLLASFSFYPSKNLGAYGEGGALVTNEAAIAQRDRVRSALQDASVETAVHYPVPVHLQKAYAHLGYKPGNLPATETLCQQCLSLPIYPELPKEKIFTVVSTLLDLERQK